MFFRCIPYHFSNQQNILALIKENDISKTLILKKYRREISKIFIEKFRLRVKKEMETSSGYCVVRKEILTRTLTWIVLAISVLALDVI